MTDEVLRVEELTVKTDLGVDVVADVDFSASSGRLLGLLGETGAGKTMTARATLGLLPPGLRARGRVRFVDQEWIPLERPDLIRRHLGLTAGLMLQNPMGAFDPLQRVGPQMIEAVVRNGLMTKQSALSRASRLCDELSLGDAEQVFRLYPHQLSGGMSQRVALALALMPSPRLLVVDEPTSALDANLRVDALRLVQSLAQKTDMAVVIISHDLGLVSRFCDEIAVLYAGHLAETGRTLDVLGSPAHPYTRTLMSCSLRLEGPSRTTLPTIGGEPPGPGQWPQGCYFHPRCPDAVDQCRRQRPVFASSRDRARGAACHFARLEESA